MPENTNHPTQKPEKLLAKIILASTNKGDLVFDPFIGSGTTAVVAKKLERKYVGVEVDELYCCLAEKRLELAEKRSKEFRDMKMVYFGNEILSINKSKVKGQRSNVKSK